MRENWIMATLGDFCEVVTKGTTPTSIGFKFTEEGVNFVKVESLTDNGKFIPEKFAHISDNCQKALMRSQLKEGDILFSIAGALGRTAIVTKNILPANTNQALSIIRLKKGAPIQMDFLIAALTSGLTLEQIEKHKGGVAQQNLSLAQVKSFNIPIPPLKEQKQIVAILDEAFAAIDQAKANIEKNIENAKELFQSKLSNIFSSGGKNWEEDTLKNVTTKIGSGSTPRGGNESYKDSGVSLIRSMNVHDDGFKQRNLAFIDDEQARKLNGVSVEEGDVLLNITGASVARCCVAPNDFLPARVNQHVSIIRPIKNKIDSEFLHYVLTAKVIKDKLLGIGEQGATRQAITKSQLETFKVAFPKSIKEQKKTLLEMNLIREKSMQLVNVYNEKIKSLEELKKSILQKAFTGELTSKNSAANNKFVLV